MTNCPEIKEELGVKCDGGHEHQQLISGRAAAAAARYPEGLCKAVRRRLMKAMRNKGEHVRKLYNLSKLGREKKQSQPDLDHDEEGIGWNAQDDATGEALDPKEVMKARAKEMGYIRDKKVWKTIKRAEAEKQGWRLIQTRWIDINKGDKDNPNYRSRFVGKEFNTGAGDGLFAATPPLEALRLLISESATRRKGGERKVIMVNDVARAFFEAPVKRKVCIELPAEAGGAADEVGLLMMSLYGTRDAASNFQAEVTIMMDRAGFSTSRYNPTTFHHKGKGVKTTVHGDDFISSGGVGAMKWFKAALERRSEVTTTVVGTGMDEVREAKVLNRIIRTDDEDGWYYEADQRHGEIIVRTLGMEGAT